MHVVGDMAVVWNMVKYHIEYCDQEILIHIEQIVFQAYKFARWNVLPWKWKSPSESTTTTYDWRCVNLLLAFPNPHTIFIKFQIISSHEDYHFRFIIGVSIWKLKKFKVKCLILFIIKDDLPIVLSVKLRVVDIIGAHRWISS